MKILRDLIYDEAHPEMDRLDVYLPAKIENAYVYFHGGGMTHGDKCTPRTEPLFRALAEQGTLVFSCNYRFLPVTDHDSAPRRTPVLSGENDVDVNEVLKDCAKAVNWAMTEGRKYGDFGRISVGGSSAGGYITMMLMLRSDLLTIMQATTNGTLAETPVEFADKSACCVVTASAGYPLAYEKGKPMTMTEEAKAHTFVAGAKLVDGVLVPSGGRVTGTTAIADSLPEAIAEAYRLSDGVKFENAYRRSDIGQRALKALM